MSGEPFSTIHGKLITEVTINWEVKLRCGLMMGGYSMSHQTKDAFIKISNVKVKVMSKLKGQVNMFSSCVQKELPPGSRKYYDHIVTDTKEEILKYCDPFFNAPAHHLKADVENDVNMVSDLLSSTEIWNEMFTKFARRE